MTERLRIGAGISQIHRMLTTQAWKQTSGDPSGQTWNCRGITLIYNFTTALLLYGVVSHYG